MRKMPLDYIRKVENGATLGLWKVKEPLADLEDSFPKLVASDAYSLLHHDLRKLEWLGARALLQAMNLSWDLSYTQHGKPYYKNGPKISLTHSRDYIAVITHPDREVGIDVQEIVDKVFRIRRKFCNEKELEWAESPHDFTRIWCAKEALFKVKEKNVHFADDMSVRLDDANDGTIIYRNSETYPIYRLELIDYECAYVIGLV